MIGWLQGTVLEKRPPALMLNVAGVGYEIQAPMTTFYTLPAVGELCSLFTHFVVREDGQQLFGFAARGDRDVFRLLLKVNGVGPKVALAILSGMETSELALCVEHADTTQLSRLPGIGRKTAERIIVDMRDRLTELDSPPATSANMSVPVRPSVGLDPVAEAVAALMALGFKGPDATQRVRGVSVEGLSSEELIRKALQGAA